MIWEREMRVSYSTRGRMGYGWIMMHYDVQLQKYPQTINEAQLLKEDVIATK